MTTAAPPEKMMELHDLTDADLAEALRLHADIFRDRDNQPIPASYLWREAARRLAPRVGDDAQDRCGHCGKWFNWELMTLNADGSWCPECVAKWNPSAPPAASAEGVFVPQSVWDWLMGLGDSFVDPEPPHPKYKRNFWWRKELRRRLSALPKGQEHEG